MDNRPPACRHMLGRGPRNRASWCEKGSAARDHEVQQARLAHSAHGTVTANTASPLVGNFEPHPPAGSAVESTAEPRSARSGRPGPWPISIRVRTSSGTEWTSRSRLIGGRLVDPVGDSGPRWHATPARWARFQVCRVRSEVEQSTRSGRIRRSAISRPDCRRVPPASLGERPGVVVQVRVVPGGLRVPEQDEACPALLRGPDQRQPSGARRRSAPTARSGRGRSPGDGAR